MQELDGIAIGKVEWKYQKPKAFRAVRFFFFSTGFHYGRGEWHSPSNDTDAFPYLRNNDAPLSGHPTPSDFNINLPSTTWF